MNKRARVVLGEGWSLLAALAVFALAGLMLWQIRLPRETIVEPVSYIPAEAFVTPAPEKLDINAATAEELDGLPGIGEELAARIVAYREEHGRFLSVEELDEVNGIGPAKLAALQGLVFAG